MEKLLDLDLLENWLEDQELVIVKINGWMLLQRGSFDFHLEGEPHHSIQLLINTNQRMYIIRVWSRTIEKGEFRSINDLKLIATKSFLSSAICSGYLGSAAPNNAGLSRVEYPFARWVSSSCAFIFQSESDLAKVGICSACSGTHFSIVDDPEQKNIVEECDQPSDENCAFEDQSVTILSDSSQHAFEDNEVEMGLDDEVVSEDLNTVDSESFNAEDWTWPESGSACSVVKLKIRKTENIPPKSKRIAPTLKPLLKSKQCMFCSEHFKTKSKMQNHLTVHHALNTYNCQLCSESRRFPKEIATHILEIHPGTETAHCPMCKGPVHFGGDPQDFEDHYKQCKKSKRNARVKKQRQNDKIEGKDPEKIRANFECHICGRILRGYRPFKYHLARHQKSELPFKCDHDGCDMAFPVLWELKL